MNNDKIFDKYKAAGFVPFSFNLELDPTTKKKILKNMPTFGIYEKFLKKNIDTRKSGHAIKMGIKLDKYFLIGFDVDNKPGIYDGLTKWRELLQRHNKNNNIDSLNTPTQETISGGYHYLFLVTRDQLRVIGNAITGLYIDNSDDKYKIDIKADNSFLICEPSTYGGRMYKWLKAPHDTPILNMPVWLYEIIIKHKRHKPPQKIKEIKITSQDEQLIEKDTTDTTEDNIYKYLECINDNRYNDYEDWVHIGRVLKNNNIPYEYFLMKSKAANNFKSDEDTRAKWDTFKKKSYKIESIYYMAKSDNIKLYNEITSQILKESNIDSLFDISKYPQLKINKKYLLNKDNTDDTIYNYINDWQTKDIKTLNIKSKYGSGKTQLLKQILTNYNPARVLWITYRQTLTDNIYDEFKKFGFRSYLDNITTADRQILQLESIHKLYLNDDNDDNDEFNDDDEYTITHPKYDLIILDEVESILNHFNSTTFKKHSGEEIYDKLFNIIKAAGKLITLDGDLNNRALKYASNFGEMLTINNEYNVNERKFNFIGDEEYFKISLLSDIDKALKENKKIALCSMSKNETIKYNNILLEHNKDLKILTINADSDDEDKKKLKNIMKEIIKYDVFIYSPSIEAGVNIDAVNMFNNLYCIVCGGSTSPRSFLQMTARIRHLNNNNIKILNNALKNNNCFNYWEYDEIKNMLKNSHKLKMQSTLHQENNKTYEKFKLTPYSETYIYNKLEKLNNNSYYFINLLCHYCKQKGIETNFNEQHSEPVFIKFNKEEYFNKIINSDSIDKEQHNELKRKINNRTATRCEKLTQSKYYYIKALGVDNLNFNILDAYYKKIGTIENFIKLIDGETLNKDSIIYSRLDKVRIVNNIINNLGFMNMYDNKLLHQDELKIKLETLTKVHPEIFTKETRALFNMAKFKTSTDKDILCHINSLLNRFSINIRVLKRQREEGIKNLVSYYGIKRVNDIDEIIYYKMQKHHKIKDVNKIINIDTTKFIYNDLITTKEDKEEIIYDDESDDEIIENINKLELDLTDY